MIPQLGDPAAAAPGDARASFRNGHCAPTAGWSNGFAQANLIAVPRDWAYDVLLYCQRNPKPCPLLDVTEPGAYTTPLAPGSDLRTDLPRYRVWREGELVEEPTDVREEWREDLVCFLIGCSFTFEDALSEAGVPLRHVEAKRNVPMYLTNQPCRPAGRIHGRMVVSMRPIPPGLIPTAVTVTSAMPAVHGAPVHVGDPEALGIVDIEKPDFGDPPQFGPTDLPVFWACGVTPQAAVVASRPPLAITHAPGHMLITDVPDREYRNAG
jgi:uncharacterized protein YcsI (UPF0317 family)